MGFVSNDGSVDQLRCLVTAPIESIGFREVTNQIAQMLGAGRGSQRRRHSVIAAHDPLHTVRWSEAAQ